MLFSFLQKNDFLVCFLLFFTIHVLLEIIAFASLSHQSVGLYVFSDTFGKLLFIIVENDVMLMMNMFDYNTEDEWDNSTNTNNSNHFFNLYGY